MDKLILNGDCNGDILVVSSNYGDSYDRAKEVHKGSNSSGVILFEIEESDGSNNCVGLSISQIKELKNYLDNLINYFENE